MGAYVTILHPERPLFASGPERQVWQLLRQQLRSQDVLMSGLRVTDHTKDHEADVVVLLPGTGVVVLEVKGGSVWFDGHRWRQHRGGTDHTVRPVDQARDTKYALRDFVEADPRWRASGHRRVKWSHAVVLPNTELPADFATPDCPRWSVLDRTQLGELADLAWGISEQQASGAAALTSEDAALIVDILRGRGAAQRDVVAIAEERDAEARRLTQEQAVILGAIRLLKRVEVRGGAGCGKTWLALEQARRLSQAGERVALLCYSRGLAAFLRRVVETWPRRQRPGYVGEFHGLGRLWGAVGGSDNDSDYWENRLPREMLALAQALPAGQRFDSIVIDEAQDFADSWWPVLLDSLKDTDGGGIYAFSDEGQRVFARYSQPPVPLVPLVLDHNLRNTKQIAEAFNPLAPMRMRLLGGDGPQVRFVSCASADALSVADDQIDRLLDTGWRQQDVALLCTGSRHPEQAERQAAGQDSYWDSFWDTDQVFYGHVLGFKGLERRVVVLALNENQVSERSRERLYVGMSRARDELVVCGDADTVREIAGEDVLKRMLGR
jgi:Nuclease-related domain/UvrD-like helicase C-terminal domain